MPAGNRTSQIGNIPGIITRVIISDTFGGNEIFPAFTVNKG